MVNSTFYSQKSTFSLPITESARRMAAQFAEQQSTPQKAEQVRLNTLAVTVVHYYLRMMDVATDLQASDSWHPWVNLGTDVADLLLPRLGKLECRPIKSNQSHCYIPPEVWADRIGYVVVEIDANYRVGTILGFARTTTSSALAINQLQPLQTLLERIHESSLVPLGQWLEGMVTTSWQTVEELFISRSAAVKFCAPQVRGVELDTPERIRQAVNQLYTTQNAVTLPLNIEPTAALVHLLQSTHDETIRWTAAEMLWQIEPTHPAAGARRILDLGLQLLGYPVALMVAILRKPDDTYAVLLRVYPMGNQPYLPEDLQLAGLYENGSPFLQATARSQDDYIQLYFGAELGERFSVRVSLDNASITENFGI